MAATADAEVVIATVVSDIARDFLSLADALTSEPRFAAQVAPTAIHDEFSRFKLWAGNIAAHRKGRRSLEYRLRDAAHLKAETHTLLSALASALQNALAIVKGERVPWDEFSESDSDSELSDDDASNEDLQGSTELKQLLASTKSVITSLFRLSMAIRDPAPNSQSKSTITVDKSFYEQHDIQHVKEKFPNSPDYLTERLGRAISGRRQYLSYRGEHHQKLAKHIEKIGFEKPTTEFTTNSTEATPIPGIERSNSLNVLDEGDDAASQTSYATSVNATIRVPPLPKEARDKDFFECPLCFLLVSIHTAAEWKQHVYRDLHPYCCTSEHCTIADRLYDSRKAWFAHELEAHRTSWQCVEGCGKTFQLESDFESHVQRNHPELASGNMLSALKRTSTKSVSLTEQTHCTLCGKSMSLRVLQKHLGSHQQQLALFALPPNLDDTEDDPNDDEQDSLKVGDHDEEDVSDFSDEPEPEIASDRHSFSMEYDSALRDLSTTSYEKNSEEGGGGEEEPQASSTLVGIELIRSDWDGYIRKQCEDFITRPPQVKPEREARYNELQRLVNTQIHDRLGLASVSRSTAPQRIDLYEEVAGVEIRMRNVMNKYSITKEDLVREDVTEDNNTNEDHKLVSRTEHEGKFSYTPWVWSIEHQRYYMYKMSPDGTILETIWSGGSPNPLSRPPDANALASHEPPVIDPSPPSLHEQDIIQPTSAPVHSAMVKLDFIFLDYQLHVVPSCNDFLRSPPIKKSVRDQVHKRLSETILTQMLWKLDGVDPDGDLEVRERRKDLVKVMQNMLNRLDEGLASANAVAEATEPPLESPSRPAAPPEFSDRPVAQSEFPGRIPTSTLDYYTASDGRQNPLSQPQSFPVLDFEEVGFDDQVDISSNRSVDDVQQQFEDADVSPLLEVAEEKAEEKAGPGRQRSKKAEEKGERERQEGETETQEEERKRHEELMERRRELVHRMDKLQREYEEERIMYEGEGLQHDLVSKQKDPLQPYRDRIEHERRLLLEIDAIDEAERGQDHAIDVSALEADLERLERTAASLDDNHEELKRQLDATKSGLEKMRLESGENAEQGASEEELMRKRAETNKKLYAMPKDFRKEEPTVNARSAELMQEAKMEEVPEEHMRNRLADYGYEEAQIKAIVTRLSEPIATPEGVSTYEDYDADDVDMRSVRIEHENLHEEGEEQSSSTLFDTQPQRVGPAEEAQVEVGDTAGMYNTRLSDISEADAMAIPRAREEVPPPLPPPRHIGTLRATNQDSVWEWGDASGPKKGTHEYEFTKLQKAEQDRKESMRHLEQIRQREEAGGIEIQQQDLGASEAEKLSKRHGAVGPTSRRQSMTEFTQAGSKSHNVPTINAPDPAYPKIHQQYLDVETLRYYDIPYEYDANPDYLIVLREMSQRETEYLLEHTRRIRSPPPWAESSGKGYRGSARRKIQ